MKWKGLGSLWPGKGQAAPRHHLPGAEKGCFQGGTAHPPPVSATPCWWARGLSNSPGWGPHPACPPPGLPPSPKVGTGGTSLCWYHLSDVGPQEESHPPGGLGRKPEGTDRDPLSMLPGHPPDWLTGRGWPALQGECPGDCSPLSGPRRHGGRGGAWPAWAR